MKKSNLNYIFFVLIAVVLIAIIWLTQCQPTPPPKPTPTYTPTPTATLVPTDITPTTEPTKTEEPEPTITPTLEPTKTITSEPTEFTLIVHTGYEDGWLHFRPGPSKIFLPDWVNGIGAFKENTVLKFIDCPPVTFPWVHIAYDIYSGYVYGEYLNINPCSK